MQNPRWPAGDSVRMEDLIRKCTYCHTCTRLPVQHLAQGGVLAAFQFHQAAKDAAPASLLCTNSWPTGRLHRRGHNHQHRGCQGKHHKSLHRTIPTQLRGSTRYKHRPLVAASLVWEFGRSDRSASASLENVFGETFLSGLSVLSPAGCGDSILEAEPVRLKHSDQAATRGGR